MFLQPCIIRKNSKKLRRQLECMGYKNDGGNLSNDNVSPYLVCCPNIQHDNLLRGDGFYISKGPTICQGIKYEYTPPEGYIDCDKNEEMFLGLAALRDDTDKYQWFAHKNGSFWWKSELDDFTQDFNECNGDRELHASDYHKASAKEIVDFFGKDEVLV